MTLYLRQDKICMSVISVCWIKNDASLFVGLYVCQYLSISTPVLSKSEMIAAKYKAICYDSTIFEFPLKSY